MSIDIFPFVILRSVSMYLPLDLAFCFFDSLAFAAEADDLLDLADLREGCFSSSESLLSEDDEEDEDDELEEVAAARLALDDARAAPLATGDFLEDLAGDLLADLPLLFARRSTEKSFMAAFRER